MGCRRPVLPPDLPDPRGRNTYSYSNLDAFIEQRTGLDRSTIDTDRSHEIVVIVLDPVAIHDEDLFRWGDPPHVLQDQSGRGFAEQAAKRTGEVRQRSNRPPVRSSWLSSVQEQ